MSLYIVSIPIGNPQDITFRALEILKKIDFVICEETKIGRKFLHQYEIKKECFPLNEHNEEQNGETILSMLKSGQEAALISDCGTPVFADPGTYLVERCHQIGIQVVPIPGVSSLMAGLVVCGFDIRQFYFAGFLPRSSEERRAAMRRFKDLACPIVIYEAPYRLNPLLEDLSKEFSKNCRITLAFNLTRKEEKIVRDTLDQIKKRFCNQPIKQEFVLILNR